MQLEIEEREKEVLARALRSQKISLNEAMRNNRELGQAYSRTSRSMGSAFSIDLMTIDDLLKKLDGK